MPNMNLFGTSQSWKWYSFLQ